MLGVQDVDGLAHGCVFVYSGLMTTTRTTPTVSSVLAHFGFASIDDAREANVAFGCFGCGSIATVTPTATSTREEQRDGIDWDCCDTDNFEI